MRACMQAAAAVDRRGGGEGAEGGVKKRRKYRIDAGRPSGGRQYGGGGYDAQYALLGSLIGGGQVGRLPSP